MPNYVRFRGNQGDNTPNTDRGPSPFIWGDCPWMEIMSDPGVGYGEFHEFMDANLGITTTGTQTAWQNGLRYNGTNTTGSIATGDAVGGVVALSNTTDDHYVAIGSGNAPYQISRSHGKLWFEARIKTSTVTDAKHDIVVGLSELTAFAAGVPLTTAGALADKNFVGFQRPESARTTAGTGGGIMNALYKADGVASVTLASDAATLTADTYVKVGMVYNPSDYYLRVYVNGIEVASSSKLIPATADGADFPNDTRLCWLFAIMNATGTSPGSSSIDWVRVAQLSSI